MSTNLTSVYNEGRTGVLATVLVLVFILTIVLNILFLFMFFRVKRPIRRPPNYFLASLAFTDLISALVWLIPSLISSILWDWILNSHLCNLHSYIAMWGYCMNMYLFVVIMFEKFAKILFPSKHKDAFYNKLIVIIIIIALMIFNMVLAFLPLVGWGVVDFFSYQFQCVPDYVQSQSHLSFVFVVTFALPVICVTILAVAILLKVKSLKQKVGPSSNAKFVLEERKDVPKESLAEKLKKQQASFQRAGMKKKKPKIGGKKKNKDKKKSGSDDGYNSETASSASSHYESSTDEDTYIRDYDDYKRMKRDQAIAKKKKRVYTFRRSDLLLAVTVLICFVIYALLWLPYWIVSFIWVHDPSAVTEAAYIFFTLLTFVGICFKPLVYASNKQLRGALMQALQCKRRKEPPPSGQLEEMQKPAVTTTVVEKHITVHETTTTTKTKTATKAGPEMVDLYQTEDNATQFTF